MSSKPKQERVKRQDAARKEMGAHARPGRNVEPLDQTEGSPRHSGRPLPPSTRAADLENEVTDLSPSGKKK